MVYVLPDVHTMAVAADPWALKVRGPELLTPRLLVAGLPRTLQGYIDEITKSDAAHFGGRGLAFVHHPKLWQLEIFGGTAVGAAFLGHVTAWMAKRAADWGWKWWQDGETGLVWYGSEDRWHECLLKWYTCLAHVAVAAAKGVPAALTGYYAGSSDAKADTALFLRCVWVEDMQCMPLPVAKRVYKRCKAVGVVIPLGTVLCTVLLALSHNSDVDDYKTVTALAYHALFEDAHARPWVLVGATADQSILWVRFLMRLWRTSAADRMQGEALKTTAGFAALGMAACVDCWADDNSPAVHEASVLFELVLEALLEQVDTYDPDDDLGVWTRSEEAMCAIPLRLLLRGIGMAPSACKAIATRFLLKRVLPHVAACVLLGNLEEDWTMSATQRLVLRLDKCVCGWIAGVGDGCWDYPRCGPCLRQQFLAVVDAGLRDTPYDAQAIDAARTSPANDFCPELGDLAEQASKWHAMSAVRVAWMCSTARMVMDRMDKIGKRRTMCSAPALPTPTSALLPPLTRKRARAART